MKNQPMRVAIWDHAVSGDTVVICATAGSVPDEALEATLDLHRSGKVKRGVLLALGDAALSHSQRKRSAEALGDHASLVITESIITKGAAMAMTWLGNDMVAAPPRHFAEALRALGVKDDTEIKNIIDCANTLRDSVIAKVG